MTPPSSSDSKINGRDLTDRELLIRIHERIEVLPDHERRLRVLERVMWSFLGAWGILAGWLKLHIMGGK